MRIVSISRAFPKHYYDQSALLSAIYQLWGQRFHNPERLKRIFSNVLVGGRHLALAIDEYQAIDSFSDANNAFIECGLELAEAALSEAAQKAEIELEEITDIFFVSSTGIATPSIDALLMNRLPLSRNIRRTPIFGLGCMAGAGGIARMATTLAAKPKGVAALVSVELCSLTLQQKDFSVANLISSGLFGDGAAALLMVGAEHRLASSSGPKVLNSQSFFYTDTRDVMGWDIRAEGFKVILSPDVPKMVREHLLDNFEQFLESEDISKEKLSRYIFHPGGPKVLEAYEDALGLPKEAFQSSYDHLEEVGNLSSASVLMILEDVMNQKPAAGEVGLLVSMGPGFCSEFILLKW